MTNTMITFGSVAENRKARFNYTILDTYEAGIMLTGGEVKSLRHGHATIGESYVSPERGELYLVNSHIDDYLSASKGFVDQNPSRPRKLLLHQKELSKLLKEIQQKYRSF